MVITDIVVSFLGSAIPRDQTISHIFSHSALPYVLLVSRSAEQSLHSFEQRAGHAVLKALSEYVTGSIERRRHRDEDLEIRVESTLFSVWISRHCSFLSQERAKNVPTPVSTTHG